jgi:hypothetical protein
LDSLNLCEWIRVILYPKALLHIPCSELHHFQVFAVVTCDFLWFHRNKAFYDGLSFDARIISKLIINTYHQHCDAWSNKLDPAPEKWIHPPPNWYKINFDTTIRDSFSCQVAICRDHESKLIKITTQIQSTCFHNKGEALAAHLVVSLSSSLHLDQFVIEGDSQVVILTLQQLTIVQDWRITDIIQHTLNIIPHNSSWSARKVNRSANFSVHYVAHWTAAQFSLSNIHTPSAILSSPTTQLVSVGFDPIRSVPVTLDR